MRPENGSGSGDGAADGDGDGGPLVPVLHNKFIDFGRSTNDGAAHCMHGSFVANRMYGLVWFHWLSGHFDGDGAGTQHSIVLVILKQHIININIT